ncbi:MAG: hypothetical protein BRD23_09275 [Halobacteriales archaeon SW_9_67_25]|jgi:hypothetical protein|nr:MAG: hypothetical protein BRD23_09275 [Halobacteriales archaeon SW_9_67_25]
MVDPEESTRRVFPPVGESTAPACSHESARQLGVDAGQNRYLRCRDCGAVIVAFSATSQWERQREALSTEPRDWNPLIDALRTKRSGPQDDPRREDTHHGDTPESLADRVRQTWRRFLGGRR